MRHLVLISFVSSILAGCVVPTPDDESTAGIIGGTTDATDTSVIALYAQTSSSGALCSASVIAPTVLLTAAHCVAASEVGSGATFSALPSGDLNKSSAERWTVKETHYDPAFDSSKVQNGHDIAVAILDEPTTLTPLVVNQADVASLSGTQVRLVGYGVNDGTAQSGAGIRRDVNAPVDAVDDKLMQIGGDGKDTCQGDSGGPAFATMDDKKVIVGITSFGESGCGDGGYDTRVDKYASFLAPYLKITATSPQTGDGDEHEPNDDAKDANDLELGSTKGTLAPTGDVDWFRFTVPGPSTFTLTVRSTRTSVAFQVYKQAASGSLSSIGASEADTLSHGSSAGGIYYVKVADDGKHHTDSGAYTLALK